MDKGKRVVDLIMLPPNTTKTCNATLALFIGAHRFDLTPSTTCLQTQNANVCARVGEGLR